MDIDAEETLFIVYREELKTIVNRWTTIFNTISYLNVPTSVANSFLSIKDALSQVDYTIPCEQKEQTNDNEI